MSEWDTTDDLSGGGNYLNQPGTYHMVILNVLDGLSTKDKPIDGFTVCCDVLAGTTEKCHGKKLDSTFFPPNPQTSDEAQAISRKRNTAFFVATDILDPNKMGQRVSIDPADAIGRQFIVKLGWAQEKNTAGDWVDSTKFLQVDYANVWHVDDPDCKDVPKNAEALALIEKQFRHDAAWFAFKKKNKKAAVTKTPEVDFSQL